MLDLGFLLLISAWSAGVGLGALRRFGPWPEHPADALALAVPLGLGMLGLAAFGLGETGALNAGGIKAVLVAGAVPGAWAGWAFLRRGDSTSRVKGSVYHGTAIQESEISAPECSGWRGLSGA